MAKTVKTAIQVFKVALSTVVMVSKDHQVTQVSPVQMEPQAMTVALVNLVSKDSQDHAENPAETVSQGDLVKKVNLEYPDSEAHTDDLVLTKTLITICYNV